MLYHGMIWDVKNFLVNMLSTWIATLKNLTKQKRACESFVLRLGGN